MAKKQKPSSTPRMTISVPGNLRERMQAVTEDVNWSAIASRAFEAAIAQIEARKQVKAECQQIQVSLLVASET